MRLITTEPFLISVFHQSGEDWSPSPRTRAAAYSLVITHIFTGLSILLIALKGQWRLAGGETAGTRSATSRTPAGVLDANPKAKISSSVGPSRATAVAQEQ